MIEQDGKVAVAYYVTIPHVVKVNSHGYVFAVRANICMAWIEATDVNAIMQIKRHCCGNNYSPVYRYANENDVRRWTNGGGS